MSNEAHRAPRPRFRARRFFARVGWFAPAALAVLVPKCPLCLAGYLAAAVGFGVARQEMCGAPAPCLPAWGAPAALAVALAFGIFVVWRARRSQPATGCACNSRSRADSDR